MFELSFRRVRAPWPSVAIATALAACSSGPRKSERSPLLERASVQVSPQRSPPSVAADPPVSPAPYAGSRTAAAPAGYKIGKPYRIGDRWYVPAEDPAYDRTGIASWYGPDFHGKQTANGETYDMHALTAAHPTLPLPSYAYVTNLANGRTILVRINDRGPYVAGRIIDLSRGSATVLGTQARGLGQVRVRFAGLAPLDGNTAAERAFLGEQPWYGASGPMSLGGPMRN